MLGHERPEAVSPARGVVLTDLQSSIDCQRNDVDPLETPYTGSPGIVSWNRCKDQLKTKAAYVAAPSVSLYLQHIKRFATDHVASLHLTKEGHADKKRRHFQAASRYSAEALCCI
jgi:hypothetical protein